MKHLKRLVVGAVVSSGVIACVEVAAYWPRMAVSAAVVVLAYIVGGLVLETREGRK